MDLTLEFHKDLDVQFQRKKKYKVLQGVLSSALIDDISANEDILKNVSFDFNHELAEQVIATNQHHSGRCWIFAGLNVMRHKLIEHYGLPSDFELSQQHIFKYDKIEKCNYAMELMYHFKMKHVKPNDLSYVYLIPSIISDGGSWHFFAGIVKKYGCIPKSVRDDNVQAKNSVQMNNLLSTLINSRSSMVSHTKTRAEFEMLKKKTMQICHRIINMCLGNSVREFTWSSPPKSRSRKFTPVEFYEQIIMPIMDVDMFVCLCNDPRNIFDKFLCVEYIGNVLHPDRSFDNLSDNLYLNVDNDLMKKMVYESIKTNTGVWVACDYSKYMQNGYVLSEEASNIKDLFDIDLVTDKKQNMIDRVSVSDHAMNIVGVQWIDGHVERFKVENSHGPSENKNGFIVMTESWFDSYVTMCVVRVDLLPSALQKQCTNQKQHNNSKRSEKIIRLKFYDVLNCVV